MGGATGKTGRRGLLIWPQATRGLIKNYDRAITPGVEAVHVPAHFVPPGSSQAKQPHHLYAQLSWNQSCHRQKYPASIAQGCFSHVQRFYTLWTVASGLLPRVFSRQEYWNILSNTGFHTLLEHYISCFPSCQLPWVPVAARTPATQASAPPPHLALTGANPSSPGKPQEQSPVDNPMQRWK